MAEDALDFSHDLITKGSPRASKALSLVSLEFKGLVIILMRLSSAKAQGDAELPMCR